MCLKWRYCCRGREGRDGVYHGMAWYGTSYSSAIVHFVPVGAFSRSPFILSSFPFFCRERAWRCVCVLLTKFLCSFLSVEHIHHIHVANRCGCCSLLGARLCSASSPDYTSTQQPAPRSSSIHLCLISQQEEKVVILGQPAVQDLQQQQTKKKQISVQHRCGYTNDACVPAESTSDTNLVSINSVREGRP